MVDRTEISALAARYKRTVASRYRSLEPTELEGLRAERFWVSPKIDGETWIAVLEGGAASLVAPNGRVFEGAALLAELAAACGRTKGRTVLAGELFFAGGKERPRVGDVGRTLAEGGSALDKLGWHAFDVVESDGAPAPATYAERLAILERVLEGGKRTKAIKTVVTDSSGELRARWDEWVAGGKAEGLVVRADDGRVFKVKPTFTLDAAIVGFTTKADAPDEARSVLLALLRADGVFQIVASVGNLGTSEARKALLAQLVARECASSFRHSSNDGVLYRWVRPEVVLEVACTDVQTEESDGSPVDRWTIAHEGGAWRSICVLPGAALLHPVAVRVRDDKSVNATDVRAEQLTERCVVEALEQRAAAAELPKSAVVRREAWTKVTKGKTAVRKLVVWRTNKESAVEGWPAWVVHFTDYSPDRKTPLERTVKTATSESDAARIAGELVAENVKKGWTAA